jgi:hypothetical protein
MERADILKILGIIKNAYPRFYQGITMSDAKDTTDLWAEMFKDDNPQDIVKAVKELICELEFPPTIADVKKRIKQYVDNRRWQEYIAKKAIEEQKEILMLEEKRKEIPIERPKADVSKHIKNIKKILFGGNKDDI